MSGRPPLALDQTPQGLEGGEREREGERERGPALEITTCDRQGEQIQEDRNNEIRHDLKWNIHSDSKACLAISVEETLRTKRSSWKSTWKS